MDDAIRNQEPTVAHLVSDECPWEIARHVLKTAAAETALGVKASVLVAKGSWAEAHASFFGIAPAVVEFGSPFNPLAWSGLGGAARKLGAGILHAHDGKAVRLMSRAAWFAGAATAATLYAADKSEAALRLGKANAVFCPSETAFGLTGGAAKARLIPAGVDVEAHKKASADRDAKRRQARETYCPENEKPLFIVAVAPFDENGGLRRLIEALPEIVVKLPQTHLLAMGCGPLFPELERIARVTALEDRITFLNPDPDLAPLLAVGDVYVATAANDAAGLALREAMAAGKAILAVDAGCNAELVEDGKTGVVCAGTGAAALSGNILDLLENRNRREHLGRMAAARAAKLFDLMKSAGETIAAYRDVAR